MVTFYMFARTCIWLYWDVHENISLERRAVIPVEEKNLPGRAGTLRKGEKA